MESQQEAFINDELLFASQKEEKNSGGEEMVYVPETRRFWELFIMSLCSAQSGLLWMTYSNDQSEAQALYGWGKNDFNLVALWFPAVTIPLAPFVPAILAVLGLRGVILACYTALSVAALLR